VPDPPPPDNGNRWFRWILLLILLVQFGQVPVYIYVLELHSSALARLEREIHVQGARVEALAQAFDEYRGFRRR